MPELFFPANPCSKKPTQAVFSYGLRSVNNHSASLPIQAFTTARKPKSHSSDYQISKRHPNPYAVSDALQAIGTPPKPRDKPPPTFDGVPCFFGMFAPGSSFLPSHLRMRQTPGRRCH
ncbi:hypothetical protein PG987_013680 [Apiospora arundinis]